MFVTKFVPVDRLHTVGYYEPDGDWHPIADLETEEEAFLFIRWLSGGTPAGWESFLEQSGFVRPQRRKRHVQQEEEGVDLAQHDMPSAAPELPAGGSAGGLVKDDF